jgi:hypothetical protein
MLLYSREPFHQLMHEVFGTGFSRSASQPSVEYLSLRIEIVSSRYVDLELLEPLGEYLSMY